MAFRQGARANVKPAEKGLDCRSTDNPAALVSIHKSTRSLGTVYVSLMLLFRLGR